MTWGHTEHLLATVVDSLQTGNWLFASAHSKTKIRQPPRLQRPGAKRDRADRLGNRRFSTVEMRHILDNWSALAAAGNEAEPDEVR